MLRFVQKILFLLILIPIIFTSCKKSRIPDDDMVKILAQVFITDASVTTTHLSSFYSKRDTIEYYEPIYSKMGYSETQFLNTIDFYLNNYEVFEKVLDRVVNELVRLESEKDVKPELTKVEEPKVKENLWDRKTSWTFPQDGNQEMLWFKIPVKGLGSYTISADVKVNPNDESLNPEMKVWFFADDGTEDGFILNQRSHQYYKDGKFVKASITSLLSDTTISHFAGYVMNHAPFTGSWVKSAEIKNIMIEYKPLPTTPKALRTLKGTEILEKKKTSEDPSMVPE